MVYAQMTPSTVEAELPQVEYVWDDLECQLLAAEVDLIFADAPAPVPTDVAPTSTTDVHGEKTRPPLHAVRPPCGAGSEPGSSCHPTLAAAREHLTLSIRSPPRPAVLALDGPGATSRLHAGHSLRELLALRRTASHDIFIGNHRLIGANHVERGLACPRTAVGAEMSRRSERHSTHCVDFSQKKCPDALCCNDCVSGPSMPSAARRWPGWFFPMALGAVGRWRARILASLDRGCPDTDRHGPGSCRCGHVRGTER